MVHGWIRRFLIVDQGRLCHELSRPKRVVLVEGSTSLFAAARNRAGGRVAASALATLITERLVSLARYVALDAVVLAQRLPALRVATALAIGHCAVQN